MVFKLVHQIVWIKIKLLVLVCNDLHHSWMKFVVNLILIEKENRNPPKFRLSQILNNKFRKILKLMNVQCDCHFENINNNNSNHKTDVNFYVHLTQTLLTTQNVQSSDVVYITFAKLAPLFLGTSISSFFSFFLMCCHHHK